MKIHLHQLAVARPWSRHDARETPSSRSIERLPRLGGNGPQSNRASIAARPKRYKVNALLLPKTSRRNRVGWIRHGQLQIPALSATNFQSNQPLRPIPTRNEISTRPNPPLGQQILGTPSICANDHQSSVIFIEYTRILQITGSCSLYTH